MHLNRRLDGSNIGLHFSTHQNLALNRQGGCSCDQHIFANSNLQEFVRSIDRIVKLAGKTNLLTCKPPSTRIGMGLLWI